MVEQCPADDPDTEVNLGCLLYKVETIPMQYCTLEVPLHSGTPAWSCQMQWLSECAVSSFPFKIINVVLPLPNLVQLNVYNLLL